MPGLITVMAAATAQNRFLSSCGMSPEGGLKLYEGETAVISSNIQYDDHHSDLNPFSRPMKNFLVVGLALIGVAEPVRIL